MTKLKLDDKSDIFPLRPAFGHDGTKITLWANYFQLDLKAQPIYKYGIAVKPAAYDGPAVPARGGEPPKEKVAKGSKKHRIVASALQKLGWRPKLILATEFQDQVVSLTKLNIPPSGAIRVEDCDPGRDRVDKWDIIFSDPMFVNLDQLLAYLRSMEDPAGDAEARFPKFPVELDALGVILGHTARHQDDKTTIVGSGRFFAVDDARRDAAIPSSRGISILRGYFQSVRPATGRLLLNVNVTHGVFLRHMPLAQLFAENSISNVNNGSFDNAKAREISRLLNRAKIVMKVPWKEKPIQRFMTGLAHREDGKKEEHPPQFAPLQVEFRSPATTRFYLRSPAPKSKASKIQGLNYDGYVLVKDYFAKRYNYSTQDQLPLINVGTKQRPEYVPAEFCTLVGGQPVKAKLDPTEQDAMIKFACRKPVDNAISITNNGRKVLGLDNNALLSHFGISVSDRLISVNGRELRPPTVIYQGGQAVSPRDGGWLMKNQRVVKAGRAIKKWACIYASRATNDTTSGGLLQQTVKAFGNHCKITGLNINPVPSGFATADFRNVYDIRGEAALTATLTDAFNKHPTAEFFLIVLPRKDTKSYAIVKKLADRDLGRPTVCVVEQKIMDGKGQAGYFTNVAVKLNLKMDGVNQSLQAEHPLLKSGKTMIVGYDVTHPTNMNIRRDKEGKVIRPPSMVGLVASIDKYLAQWPSETWSNEGGQEMLDNRLEAAMDHRLTMWAKNNKNQLPDNILIYRDGVSEGQFKTVLDEELPFIRTACQKRYGNAKKQPRITLIVSVKRHHTRFYPTDPSHTHMRSKSPKEGTVVDRGVTAVRYWDFFLQAHASLQGTARPAHYTVLLDDIFRADYKDKAAHELESLTHSMCYLYGRATKAVSICPPAYYADLVCTRARLLNEELYDDTQSNVSGQSAPRVRVVHEKLKNSMYYI
ncbi:post-transcriptional gene silencing protein QDE-2 [Coniochaeta sp. 2T2.1]|nr:post-transcriptional gene silencing protein QDE-2 [Coniochaeta sp. 2T2.1]